MPDPLDAIRSTILGDEDGDGVTTTVPARTTGPRYQRVGVLGSGGMGRVEHALDRDLRRDVAVKLLRPELGDDRALIEQFLWEARVTAHLDHPNIVPIHDLVAVDGGELFFTMKLVRGRTLAELIAALRAETATAVPMPKRLRMFLPICQAVGFAHSRGVLHRDLKPGNVMIGEYGEILVTDWGLAQPLPGSAGDAVRPLAPSLPRMRSAGTPAYMSPEQASGGALDERSDVYALGALLYELVSLHRPIDGDTLSQLVARVTRGEVAPLRTLCPDLPAGLDAVVAKAMATDPGARYPDAAALAADVEIVLDGRAPEAEHASLLTRFGRYYVGRDPAMAAIRPVDIDLVGFAGMLLGLGIGLLVAGWLGGWWWMFFIAAVLASIPPVRRFVAVRRALK